MIMITLDLLAGIANDVSISTTQYTSHVNAILVCLQPQLGAYHSTSNIFVYISFLICLALARYTVVLVHLLQMYFQNHLSLLILMEINMYYVVLLLDDMGH